MSKSLGNLVFVSDLLKDWEPAAVRLAIIAHHYRSDWEWYDGADARSDRPPRRLAGRRARATAPSTRFGPRSTTISTRRPPSGSSTRRRPAGEGVSGAAALLGVD